jgi:hypothetical protein
MPKEERDAKGLLAREWVTSYESGMSARQMCENVIDAMNESFEKFIPRPRFDLHKITDRPKKARNFVPYPIKERLLWCPIEETRAL